MRQLYFNESGIKKLEKLNDIRITRTIISYRHNKIRRIQKVDFNFNPNLNGGFKLPPEDWLTIEGITKLGFNKCYYYDFYSKSKLEELKILISKLN